MTVLSKPAYIRDYSRKTHVYTRLWKKNPRIGRKIYKNKVNGQTETKFTSLGYYWVIMPPEPTQKHRNQSNRSTLNAKNPQRKTTRNLPSIVVNSITEKTSYGLGCTTTDRETKKINPFPICKRNTTSNTKGSRNIPYSGWLM